MLQYLIFITKFMPSVPNSSQMNINPSTITYDHESYDQDSTQYRALFSLFAILVRQHRSCYANILSTVGIWKIYNLIWHEQSFGITDRTCKTRHNFIGIQNTTVLILQRKKHGSEWPYLLYGCISACSWGSLSISNTGWGIGAWVWTAIRSVN
jgi:hypothetical protein